MDFGTGLLILAIAALIPVSMLIFGHILLTSQQDTFRYFESQAQIGGQPVSVVKAAQDIENEFKRAQIKRIETLSLDRVTALGD